MALLEKFKYNNVKQFVNTTNNNEYELLTEEADYQNSMTDLLVRHKQCNKVFKVNGCHFINDNNKCPFCQKHRHFKKTTDEFKKEVFNLVDDEYSVIGEYTDSKHKILMKHNVCGNEYEVLPGHFLNTGCRCPNCTQCSRGETRINRLLKQSNINFSRQYTFKDLYNIGRNTRLEFDFAIFDSNNSLKCLIEYDGEGHFYPIFPAGGTDEEKQERLARQQRNDELKNKYCLKHNIKLYRISCKEKKNIPEFIKNVISEMFNDYPEKE